jgi:hypothetical protein
MDDEDFMLLGVSPRPSANIMRHPASTYRFPFPASGSASGSTPSSAASSLLAGRYSRTPSAQSRLPPLDEFDGYSVGGISSAASGGAGGSMMSSHRSASTPQQNYSSRRAAYSSLGCYDVMNDDVSPAPQAPPSAPTPSKAFVEEITVERELPFVTPQKASVTSALPPQSAARSAAASNHHDARLSSASGPDPAQRYATALRNLQESPGSLTSRNGDSDQQPNGHLFQRKFELTRAMDGNCVITRVPAADSSVLPRTSEDDSSESSPKLSDVFNCSKEVSAIVNIGDAALCRMITVRTAFSSEREAHEVFLDVTRTLAEQVARQLDAHAAVSLPIDQDAAQDTQDENEDSGAEKQGENCASGSPDDMYALGKEILRSSDGAALILVQDALQAASHCSSEQRKRVANLLKYLASEAAAGATLASSGSTSHLQPLSEISAHVELLMRRESEARAAGNINLGVAAKREVMDYLHTSVKTIVGELEAALSANNLPVSNRRQTDENICMAMTTAEEVVRESRAKLEKTTQLSQKAAGRVTLAESQRCEHHRELMTFLGANSTEVSSVLCEIDALHAKLETLVHQRNTRVKNFVQSAADDVVHVQSLRRELSSLEHSTLAANKSVEQAHQLVRACTGIKDAVTPFRVSLDARNETLARERQERLAQMAESGAELAGLLHHQLTSWIEVLMKNSARESDRIGSLQQSVRDAMERYHQADKELCEQQLQDCAGRKRTVDAEVQSLEDVLRSLAAYDKIFATFIASGLQSSAAAAERNSHRQSKPSSGALLSYETPEKRKPLAGEVQTPAPPTTLVIVDETRESDPTDGSALLHIDSLHVTEFVPLFKKNPATTQKWIALLVEKDVETLGDVRDLRCTAMWATFLQAQPLLKAQLEVLMDNPQRFC